MDDLVLIADNIKVLEEMMNELNKEEGEAGLIINMGKTKLLGERENIATKGRKMEKVK